MSNNNKPPSNRLAILDRGLTAARTIWLYTALSACIAAAALTVVFVFVVLPAERQDQSTSAWIEHTYQVLDAVNGVMMSAADAETGQRGFLLTGDVRFLQPYTDGIRTIHQHFAEAQRLTVDNPDQQNFLRIIGGQIDARLAVLAKSVELGRGGDFTGAANIIRADTGKALMDALRDWSRE